MINRADNFNNLESAEDKKDRLLKMISESAYHQMIKDAAKKVQIIVGFLSVII